MADRIWMTEEQKRKVSRHIKKMCCNYDEGNCIALDDGDYVRCVQCHSYSLRCRWYINAVLPADPALEAELFKIKAKKYCRICGKALYTKNNAAKFCSECAMKRRRKREAERQRKRYLNLRKTRL